MLTETAVEEREFVSVEAAASVLADELAATLRSAIAIRGAATLAVSGGRTPGRVFDRLSVADLDWSRVTVTLTDERWVPPQHPDSNERLVRARLLRGPAARAEFVGLYGGEDTPSAGFAACERRLKELPMPLDAVYLGMGADGHFASLFPRSVALEARTGLCVPVSPSIERAGRMSLTVPMIMAAKRLFLLFSGADKRAAYEESKKRGSYQELPLRLVLTGKRVPLLVLSSP